MLFYIFENVLVLSKLGTVDLLGVLKESYY